jgi:hypothetical protein
VDGHRLRHRPAGARVGVSDRRSPTVVEQTQEAISWLSRAIVELHDDTVEVANTLSEALARLLTVWVFIGAPRDPAASG